MINIKFMRITAVFTYLCLFAGIGCLYGQDYSVASVPENLMENADCIIRNYTRDLEITSVNAGIQRIRRVITVLRKDGESGAALFVRYDRNSSVNIRQITLYDKNGGKIRSVKLSEVKDHPAFSGSELFSEERIKVYEPVHAEIPYTVEYLYEIKFDNLISYGSWRPSGDYNTSVQFSAMSFTHPIDVKVSIKEINISRKTAELRNNQEVLTWEIRDQRALVSEPFDSSPFEKMPAVYLMPLKLKYDEYTGKAGNWRDFGDWIFSLYKGRDLLTEEDKERVRSIKNAYKDTIEIARQLYGYVQGKTRYVAITMGLGGFQPFDAITVARTGYGDCKALTNYMYSLLKEAGIYSCPALVSSGTYREKIFRDFPNFNQFDHVILCLPDKKDTVWLECTNQNIPFGFLGDFTDNRDVLLLTEKGGVFAHTSKYGDNDNTRICRSEFEINTEGAANCHLITTFKGLQYDNISHVLNSTHEEQKKFLYANSMLPSLQIQKFSMECSKEAPVATIKESNLSNGFCTFSGNYMILALNRINAQKPIAKMLKKRESDILISRSFIDYDTMVYRIPSNFKVETVPEGKTIESRFGSYSSTVSRKGNEIVYTRKFHIKEGYYKPEEYTELYEFILNVSNSDNLKAIITKT